MFFLWISECTLIISLHRYLGGFCNSVAVCLLFGRVKTECDGTRAESRFGLPAKRTSPFISAEVSVQSAAGSRGVRISGNNAG